MMNRLMPCVAALVLLAVAAPAAAQTSIRDRDILNREHSGNLSPEERGQLDGIKASKAAEDAKHEAGLTAARMRAAQALRKTPPLPAERNGLLGSWRLGDDQRSKAGAVDVLTSSRSSLAESLAALKSFDNFGCGLDWGGGITFTPSTFSWRKAVGRAVEGAPIAYRSGRGSAKQVIVAITDYDFAMAFEIASPNSIVDDKGCVLVRVGAPAANAAANATTAPGNARSGAASPSAPTASTIQYGSYVCGNERVEVFYCRNDRGQPVPEIDNSCAVEYPDRPRRNPSFPVSAAVLKSDLVKQLATCKLSELHLPGLQLGKKTRRSYIAACVNACEAGGIRYGADDTPVFVR